MKLRYFYVKGLLVLVLILMASGLRANSVVKGKIIEKGTNEPLIGVSVYLDGTTTGTVTDVDGNYELKNIADGSYILKVRYMGFETITKTGLSLKGDQILTLNFVMVEKVAELGEIAFVGKKNTASEAILKLERKNSDLAIENIGAGEMSAKGIGNVQEGVKKITGVSFENSGQLFVRGLGDRYSTTTLNGLPIASPNPDNKLIPLNLFPTSTVQNVTVSKVFDVKSFADYSGAHINIDTKELKSNDKFFSVSFGTGGNTNTLSKDFYGSDKRWGLWKTNNLGDNTWDDLSGLTSSEFTQYIQDNDIFKTGFNITRKNTLPDLTGSVSYGNEWRFDNGNSMGLITSAYLSNEQRIIKDGYVCTRNTDGLMTDFNYDSYNQEMKAAGLLNLSYYFGGSNAVYTVFYTRDASDNYKYRDGHGHERYHLIGVNSVFHEYSLLNNQLHGKFNFNDNLSANYGLSYCMTGSYEPDRRQVMYRVYDSDGNSEDDHTDFGQDMVKIHYKNSQETMRYFGELTEDELVGDLYTTYKFGDKNSVKLGGSYKNKQRDFKSIRFFYNYNTGKLNPEFTSKDQLLHPDDFITDGNIADGNIKVIKNYPPSKLYDASSVVSAAYTEAGIYPFSIPFLINVGLRMENCEQIVHYSDDSGRKLTSKNNAFDLFPMINLKYDIDKEQTLRFSASKTITRPSFIEMAPFRYQESYGSKQLQGNEDISNAYNYNYDFRYERMSAETKNLVSVTVYYKKLIDPIEQTQTPSGGNTVYSFENSKEGTAMGMEFEISQKFFENFKFTFNGTYMYTDVILQNDGGISTESNRALQGASPYLLNADLMYSKKFGGYETGKKLGMSLLYNLQGPRIQAIGVYGRDNVIQKAFSSLDYNVKYSFNTHLSVSAGIENLLNSQIKYTQENSKKDNEEELIAKYKEGINFKISAAYKF